MNGGLSFSHLILQASFLAQVILALLLLASILSWAVILSKRSLLARAKRNAADFEGRFWSGGTLGDLYTTMTRNREPEEGVAAIFKAGYEEFARQQGLGGRTEPEDALAAVQRQMRVAQVREVERLEGGLSMLATVASASPYVGLFGTVWGIMSAFIAIGNVKQASLAMVAPGIAEALIATAMGLFAAIPAMIAFNFLSRAVDQLETRYHTFSEEMIGIVDRGLRGHGTKA
ncbi:MAG: protein TolQ [Nevskiaceae bacterium]|nr:MAG: protein TolQ [Nevskiaceae bacterium]